MGSIETQVFGGRWAVAERAAKPAWVQIEEQLADRIGSGHLAPGERLPAERDLALALSVSRMTVRQALASLAARGLVERGVGRGTFVRDAPRVVHDLTRVAGFTEEVERQGLEAGAQILAAGEHAAPGEVAQALGIDAGAPVVRLERVRLGGDAADDARGHLGAARALPRAARARPVGLAVRAHARALRPRAGQRDRAAGARRRALARGRGARRPRGLAADARGARRVRGGRHARSSSPATATAATGPAS